VVDQLFHLKEQQQHQERKDKRVSKLHGKTRFNDRENGNGNKPNQERTKDREKTPTENEGVNKERGERRQGNNSRRSSKEGKRAPVRPFWWH
jgi:hypothetical protein